MTKYLLLLIAWGVLIAPCALAQQQQLAPSFWKQRLFYIPYRAQSQGQSQGTALNPIAKVQLLISRSGANDWRTLEEAQPNVQGFSYHAPEDGEYWFALRHLDSRGQPWPRAAVQPQMRVVVDTELPQLTLEGTPDGPGQIVVRYEARDAYLQAESLRVEVLGASERWTPLPMNLPDIAQPDRLLGRVTWTVPRGMQQVQLRASVTDQAGNSTQATTDVSVSSTEYRVPSTQTPVPQPQNSAPASQNSVLGTPYPAPSTPSPDSGPTLGNPNSPSNPLFQSPQTPLRSPQTPRRDPAGAGADPFAAVRQLPSQDWPATNRLPTKRLPKGPQPLVQVPPPNNPYTSAHPRTPAQLVGEGSPRSTADAQDRSGSLRVTPLGPDNAPALMGEQMGDSPQPSRTEGNGPTSGNWAPAQAAATADGGSQRVVNSRTFDVEYDLQSVGPWGVAKVELWGTHDDGRTWQSFGVDPDNRSPIRVTVPAAGTFGFRILVDGANSAGAAPPRSGDAPELRVSVDLQPPTAELLASDVGSGNLSGHLLVRWTATDTNLESRPIAIFYSSYPNGPWSTIASGLENTGSYTWRIERHVPGRFYLRLEARDTAGNVATFQSPTPVELDRPQPMGHLRNVRPVKN